MNEKVRLVVWDLDETFWRGTLTEGGIDYLPEHHNIVIELARRGIVSSICSRNDHQTIENLLKEKGLWDYFVFPSIDWTAKGPRLQALVQASQLRAPTVLFIDDNPMNLAEAQAFVEGIQVADPSVIKGMLDNPLLQGKDDHDLSRLKHYQILERRAGEMSHAADPADFLRGSDIQVAIDYDIEPHIDRAIELINRTNQLNFTKVRLSENMEDARRELRSLLADPANAAGLVHVRDRYGDYGHVGFYVLSQGFNGPPALHHYCFSCRTLGMQVETWLYQRLGRPDITIAGNVVTDILAETPIDWIHSGHQVTVDNADAGSKQVSRIVLRGGCEMVALSHYFREISDTVIEETANVRDGMVFRPDAPEMAHLALSSLSQPMLESLLRLGYQPSHFETALSGEHSGPQVWVLSFWHVMDYWKHRDFDIRVNIHFPDLLGVPDIWPSHLPVLDPSDYAPRAATAISELQAHYDHVPQTSHRRSLEAALRILRLLPRDSHAFVLGLSTRILGKDGTVTVCQERVAYNNAMRVITDAYDNVSFILVDDYVFDDLREREHDPNHFNRIVYFRVFDEIRRQINALDLTLAGPSPTDHDHGESRLLHNFDMANPQAWLVRGELALINKKPDEAEQAFGQALRLAPDDQWVSCRFFSTFRFNAAYWQRLPAVRGGGKRNGVPHADTPLHWHFTADNPALLTDCATRVSAGCNLPKCAG
ncbi:hypothetical protein SXCC_02998 [Gluconacetobacter sp. SXCC-1]|nr:hypothetical protein CT154_13410 [Komagataeibacter xylinus]EGG76374.1 hypothetical protein SXCC_02998 [Gluconacetobacter sp. SXCC-1]